MAWIYSNCNNPVFVTEDSLEKQVIEQLSGVSLIPVSGQTYFKKRAEVIAHYNLVPWFVKRNNVYRCLLSPNKVLSDSYAWVVAGGMVVLAQDENDAIMMVEHFKTVGSTSYHKEVA